MKKWTVRDVMTAVVVTVREGVPYRAIVDLLARHDIGGVPVVDEAGRVVGVVSEADLLYKMEFPADSAARTVDYATPVPDASGDRRGGRAAAGDRHPVHGATRIMVDRRRRRTGRRKAAGMLAGELMTTPPITVRPGEPVAAAAKLMDEARVKRLPVVDDAGRLVGVVSRGDLLSVYLRADEEIRQEIEEEILRRALWLEPDIVTVEVRQGVVRLAGELDRRSTAEVAVQLVGALPGVVAVADGLTYRFDDGELHGAAWYRSHPDTVPTRWV